MKDVHRVEVTFNVETNGLYYTENPNLSLLRNSKDTYLPAGTWSSKNIKSHPRNYYYNPNPHYDENGISHDIYIAIPFLGSNIFSRLIREQEIAYHHPNVMIPAPVDGPSFDLVTKRTACEVEQLLGFMFTSPTAGTLTKASPISITPAEQDPDDRTVPTFHVQSASGAKTILGKTEDESSNTFFITESMGKTHFTGTAVIDVQQLAFLSASDLYGRRAIYDGRVDLFRKQLGERTGLHIPEPDFYTPSTDVTRLPEYGILFSKEVIKYLLEYALTCFSQRIIDFRSDASLVLTGMSIKVITSRFGRADDANVESIVIKPGSEVVIEDFDCPDFYDKVADTTELVENWAKRRAEIETATKARKNGKKTKKSEDSDDSDDE